MHILFYLQFPNLSKMDKVNFKAGYSWFEYRFFLLQVSLPN